VPRKSTRNQPGAAPPSRKPRRPDHAQAEDPRGARARACLGCPGRSSPRRCWRVAKVFCDGYPTICLRLAPTLHTKQHFPAPMKLAPISDRQGPTCQLESRSSWGEPRLASSITRNTSAPARAAAGESTPARPAMPALAMTTESMGTVRGSGNTYIKLMGIDETCVTAEAIKRLRSNSEFQRQ
jgi:hypothetical protein